MIFGAAISLPLLHTEKAKGGRIMVHFFDSDIAKKYGVNAAVLTAFLWDCVEQKSTESPQLTRARSGCGVRCR